MRFILFNFSLSANDSGSQKIILNNFIHKYIPFKDGHKGRKEVYDSTFS